jgi:hypothetical protein
MPWRREQRVLGTLLGARQRLALKAAPCASNSLTHLCALVPKVRAMDLH